MRTVCVLSGGLDSTVLLHYLLNQGREVNAISVDYGQRHSIELERASAIVGLAGVPWRCVDLSGLRYIMTGSSQTDLSVPVPHGHYEEESMKKTVVPNRNMLLLAVAGAMAVSLKADSIAYGAHAGDHAIYPDCREEFCAAMSQAFKHCDWHTVNLERPFLDMTKADIVKLGAQLGAPLELTYSCYEGKDIHCGKCGTCTERREAFQLAGVPDFTTYLA